MMYCMIKDYNESMSQLQTSLPVANALHYLQVFFSVFNLIKNGGDFLEVNVIIKIYLMNVYSRRTIQVPAELLSSTAVM